MKAKYVQKGDVVDFIPVANVEAGEIVRFNGLVGITSLPVTAGTVGGIAVSGVFDVNKNPASAFAVGDTVYWNFTTGQAETSGDVTLGLAVKSASAGSEWVRILLRGESSTPVTATSIEWQTL